MTTTKTIRRSVPLLAACLFLLPAAAAAQEDPDLVDIDVGSTRIGGPGATSSERKAEAAFDEPDEYITEDNLPKVGSKQRLPALHVLAKRTSSGKDWEAACRWYDLIIQEGGEEAMDMHPEAKKRAWRSYIGCAERMATKGNEEAVERWLSKSEKWGPSDHRHQKIRRDIAREKFHEAAAAGDMFKAVELFDAYQAMQADEDERIWMGAQLASKAVEADAMGDKKTRDQMMGLTEKVSPQNPDLRELESKLDFEKNVGKNIILIALGALVLAVGGTRFAKWRARAKVEAAAGGKLGKKNKFLDDDDV